ncbi:LysR family transcriptional regulator [Mesorhizobium captivum]|uniref:LysR family transcriptional regulator n=1 Tax=Mesorhizobium captivum TaxID=3072319 RepID=UPI002A24BA4D|nr:LysR family transcriptional regulator [Mesorhizobium sp. VK22E]MDX8507306.1 LysR family transcriptional regulator [Mesorhizobium sp. VK22E]
MDNQIELRALRHFVRVSELGSISRAAVELRIAQPALSRQMRRLEETLGVQLFIRDGRGVALTESGAKLRDEVANVLLRLENACLQARIDEGSPAGAIRVGVLPNLGPTFMAELILGCRQQFPRVNLKLLEGFTYQTANWIQSKQIDLGFAYDVDSYHHLNPEFRFQEEVYLVGSKKKWAFGERVVLSELEGLPLIIPAPPSYTRRRLEAAAHEQKVELTFKYEIDSIPLIKRMIALDEGYGIFSRACLWEDLEGPNLSVAAIERSSLSFELALTTAYGTILPPAARHIISFLEQMVRRYVELGRWSGEFITRGTSSSTTS